MTLIEMILWSAEAVFFTIYVWFIITEFNNGRG